MNFIKPHIDSGYIPLLHKPFIQHNIIEGMEVCMQDPAYATPNLSQWFRSKRSLGSKDRKVVAEALYCFVRFHEWFAHHNIHSIEDKIQYILDPDPATHTTDISQLSLWEYTKIQLSIPEIVATAWAKQLQNIEMVQQFAQHMQQRAPMDIRCNAHLLSRDLLLRSLQKSEIPCSIIDSTPYGIRLHKNTQMHTLQQFTDGLLEIQDSSSQLFCASLPIQKKTTVFDMCAGAGGKSLAIAAMGATVYAHDPRSHALQELQKRAQKSKLHIQTTIPKKQVDIVVVDAPCSGSGRLRREPLIRLKWQKQSPLQWVEIQQKLLMDATKFVQPNGCIAYATCSLLPEENAHDIPGWTRETRYIWPHIHDSDGFSWSIYRRTT